MMTSPQRSLLKVHKQNWVRKWSYILQNVAHLLFPDCLEKEWVSPIYVFFNRTPCIKYVDKRQVHVFVCAASHCKGKHGHDVCCFLDTGDAKSTSSLHRHAKMCWGNKAVSAADNTKDLEGIHTILAKSGLKRNRSITQAFERIGKEKAFYLHYQYTYTETRYIVQLTWDQKWMVHLHQDWNHLLDHRE